MTLATTVRSHSGVDRAACCAETFAAVAVWAMLASTTGMAGVEENLIHLDSLDMGINPGMVLKI